MEYSAEESTRIARRGLARLLLKLSAAQRDALREVVKTTPILNELIEAYEEASTALERFSRQGGVDPAIVSEYEIMCFEIESDLMAELIGALK